MFSLFLASIVIFISACVLFLLFINKSKAYEELLDTYEIAESFLKDSSMDMRMLYNALLFNEWHRDNKYEVFKTKRNHNGDYMGNYFLVGAYIDGNQISCNYHLDHWDKFKIPLRSNYPSNYDGHTSRDVITRLENRIDEK